MSAISLMFNSRVCLIPAVPSVVEAAITKALTYVHRRYIRGKEAYQKFGQASGQELTPRTFVRKEANGSLCVPAGFTHKVCEILQSFGYSPSAIPHGFANIQPNWHRLKSKVDFRESQQETIETLISAYHGGVEAAPGYGKGFIIWCLTELFPESTFDITADSVVVCRTLQDYLAPHVPDLGFVGDGSRKKGSRVTIYVLDSLHHSEGDSDFLIVDEVHTAVTDKASAKFAGHKRARRLWFSASPQGRSDNADIRVEALFGRPAVKISYQEGVRMGLIVNLRINWIDVILDHDPIANTSDPHLKAKFGIWRNTPRNVIFGQRIKEIPESNQTLVLVSKVEHLCNLYPHIGNFEIAYGANEDSIAEATAWADIGFVPRSCTEDRANKNENMRKAFASGQLKKVIVTSIWDTGANFPQLTDIVRCDPFDSGPIKDKQAPSRGSRIHGTDKEYATVHDAVDRWNDGMYDRTLGRRRRYLSQGWEEIGWT